MGIWLMPSAGICFSGGNRGNCGNRGFNGLIGLRKSGSHRFGVRFPPTIRWEPTAPSFASRLDRLAQAAVTRQSPPQGCSIAPSRAAARRR
jgi:hypothetical protein